MVSIHAPRTGRDVPDGSFHMVLCGFNPRAPHGARLGYAWATIKRMTFQSTRPARGATRCGTWHTSTRQSFNPRAPHGARL